MRIPKIKLNGEYFHGTSIEVNDNIFDEFDSGYSNWDAIWFSEDEYIAEEFSENSYRGDGEIYVIYRVNIKAPTIADIDYDKFKELLYHYELSDLREIIPILADKGYNGWKTIGSIGPNVYDDIAMFNLSFVSILDVKLKINDDWTDYMSLNDAQKMLNNKKMNEEKLVGGKGDNKTPKDIAKKFDVPVDKIKQQIKKGTDVEGEHTNNKAKAKEIATDHETEIPNYYDELETMEKNIKENKSLIKKLLREQMEEGLASTIGGAAMALSTLGNPNVPTKPVSNPIENNKETLKSITKNPDGSYTSIAKTDGPTKELAQNLALQKAKTQVLQKLNLGLGAINATQVVDVKYQKYKDVIVCTITVKVDLVQNSVTNLDIDESLEPTPQFRFDRRVYLTYVDQGDNFKHVKTKKEFYDKLYPLADDVKVYEYDMNDIYRLADEKETWFSKNKTVLGQIWKDGDIESYWINKEFMG